VRAAAWSKAHPDAYTAACTRALRRDAVATCLRAQSFFSIGLRAMYLFIPLTAWVLGGAYLLGSMALVTGTMALFDQV
jgi:uncharacterized membrane protein